METLLKIGTLISLIMGSWYYVQNFNLVLGLTWSITVLINAWLAFKIINRMVAYD